MTARATFTKTVRMGKSYDRRYADPTRSSGREAAELTRQRNRDTKQKRLDDRETEDAAMTKLGARPDLSQADQNAVIQRRQQELGTVADPRAPRLAAQTTPRMRQTQGQVTMMPNDRMANTMSPEVAAMSNAPGTLPGTQRTKFDTTQINEAATTGRTVSTPYGQVSSRAPASGETFRPEASANGVSNAAISSTQRNLELQKRHPNIFVAGTPENAAFVAHANDPKLGLKSAYANVDKIMEGVASQTNMAKAPLSGQSPATARNDINDTSTEAQAGRDARFAKSQAETAASLPRTPAQQVAGNIRNKLGAAAVGAVGAVDRNVVAPAANFVSGAVDFAKGLVKPGAAPTARYEPIPADAAQRMGFAPKNPVDFTAGGGRSFTQGTAPIQPAAPKPMADFTASTADEEERRRKMARGF